MNWQSVFADFRFTRRFSSALVSIFHNEEEEATQNNFFASARRRQRINRSRTVLNLNVMIRKKKYFCALKGLLIFCANE
jgi:hypothetical protein